MIKEKLSEHFGLNKGQYELDFVDIFTNHDTPLFIDPWSFRQDESDFSVRCHAIVSNYFSTLIDKIRNNDKAGAVEMMNCLHEPSETHLGLSRTGVKGSAIGGRYAENIYDKLLESKAMKTGQLEDLEDCALMIEGVNADKISDIVTNLIRFELIKYTKKQCDLHEIELKKGIATGYYWNIGKGDWASSNEEMLVLNDSKILLVPKFTVRVMLSLDPKEYYEQRLLPFEQSRQVDAATSLCKTLKSGEIRPPAKKVLKEKVKRERDGFKDYVLDMTRETPLLLEKYKKEKANSFKAISDGEIVKIQDYEKISRVDRLNKSLKSLSEISQGTSDADRYHNLMIGILEQIFSPDLVIPKKEDKINEGRKRIDISYENRASSGFFSDICKLGIPCKKIYFECKNLSHELKNPEYDQMNGRFARGVSKFGFILCRTIEDREKSIKSCNDFVKNNSHYIIVLCDDDINSLIDLKIKTEPSLFNEYLENKLKDIQ